MEHWGGIIGFEIGGHWSAEVLLGAAIGDNTYIGQHTAKRAGQAGELLEPVAGLENPHVGLRDRRRFRRRRNRRGGAGESNGSSNK